MHATVTIRPYMSVDPKDKRIIELKNTNVTIRPYMSRNPSCQ